MDRDQDIEVELYQEEPTMAEPQLLVQQLKGTDVVREN